MNNIKLMNKEELEKCQEKLHELGIPRDNNFYSELENAIKNIIKKNYLISHVLKFLINNEKMYNKDYDLIKNKLNRKTPWRNGNRGAIHNLKYSDHSWMSQYQYKYGDIIIENDDDSISLSEIWKYNSLSFISDKL